MQIRGQFAQIRSAKKSCFSAVGISHFHASMRLLLPQNLQSSNNSSSKLSGLHLKELTCCFANRNEKGPAPGCDLSQFPDFTTVVYAEFKKKA